MNTEATTVPSTETIQAITRKEKMSNLINELIDACQVPDILEKLSEIKTMKTLKEQKSSLALLSNQSLVATKKMDSSISNDGELCFESTSDIDVDDTEETTDIVKPKPIYATKLLKDRIGNHWSYLKNYDKVPCHRIDPNTYVLITWSPDDRTIGKMMRINEIPHLSILDIDINHDDDPENQMSEEEAAELKDKIIKFCKKHKYVLAQTPSGGFHIYCNCDNDWIEFAKARGSKRDICRITKVKICKGLDLDIFTSMEVYESEEHKKAGTIKVNNVLMVPSKAKSKRDGNIHTSKFIVGSYDSIVDYDIVTVLKELEWYEYVVNHTNETPAPKKQTKKESVVEKQAPKQTTNNDFGELDLSKYTLRALVDGIKGFEIHNYTNSRDNADDEVTLLVMFKAINCIDDEDLREEAYLKCRDICTAAAKSRFVEEKKRHAKEKSSLGMLLKIIKRFNPNYYEDIIRPSFGGVCIKKFDINDGYCLENFQTSAKSEYYTTLYSAASDLARIYRYHQEGEDYFIEKGYDADIKMKVFRYVKFETVHRKLKDIKLFDKEINLPDGKTKWKTFYAWDAFIEYKSHFNFYGIRFNSKEEGVINYFHGYNHQTLDECDEKIIADFLKLIKEGIANDDENVYNYLLNWISYVLQNPGMKTMVSIVLKGTQGAGKNTFTDILAALMAGYSQANVTKLEDLTGSYNKVLENCMFMVLNEMKSMKDSYVQNIDALKSIITDPTYRINEKFEPMRTVENVCNFIFISNNSKPLIVPPNDRRYLVLNVSDKFKGQKFLCDLHYNEERNPDEYHYFYDNLLTFFLKRDISGFDPTDIPMTDAKRDLMEASRTPTEDWIVQYHNKLVEGMTLEDIKSEYKKFFGYSEDVQKGFKNFQLQLKDKCIKGGRYHVKKDGQFVYLYKLTSENEKIYAHETLPDTDDTETEKKRLEEQIKKLQEQLAALQ